MCIMNKKTVDVIIPTYKPDKSFFSLIEALENQTLKPEKIILMNTEEKYLSNLLYGTTFLKKYGNIKIKNLSKREFNHGKTRNEGTKLSDSEIMVFMTQDAFPADEFMLERLADALNPDMVAVAYGRQLPSDTSSAIEKFSRAFNYPPEDGLKGKDDLERLGVKTYFCSNVCAAYKREKYNELGGFVRFTIFNEDMLFAAKVIDAGYKIAYAAQAKVIHSHDYTAMQQLKRNFDLGVSQADHPEVFGSIKSESEGMRLVQGTVKYLINEKKPYLIPRLIVMSAAKLIGYKLGKNYKKLSKKMILKLSMSPDYWRRYWEKNEIPENVYAGYGKTQEEMERKYQKQFN